jgi:hypothetical protein
MLATAPGRIVGRVLVQLEDAGLYRIVLDGQPDSEKSAMDDVMPVVNRAVVTAFIRARPDLVWLHAGAMKSEGRALVLIGGWGHGKSTIAASLLNRGWTYLSDDIAPFDPANLTVHPFPEMPRVRRNPGALLDRAAVARLPKFDVGLNDATIARAPSVCAGLIFPKYDGEGANRVYPCPPSVAVLKVLESCLSFAHHREVALRFASSLAQRVPAFHLSFCDADLVAAQLIEAFASPGAESVADP